MSQSNTFPPPCVDSCLRLNFPVQWRLVNQCPVCFDFEEAIPTLILKPGNRTGSCCIDIK